MMEKLKKLLALVRILRQVKGADAGAELAGAKRAGKALLVGVVVAVLQGLAAQAGPECGLGPTACAALQDPTISVTLMALLLGLEKTINEKYGLGIQALDTVKREEPK